MMQDPSSKRTDTAVVVPSLSTSIRGEEANAVKDDSITTVVSSSLKSSVVSLLAARRKNQQLEQFSEHRYDTVASQTRLT